MAAAVDNAAEVAASGIPGQGVVPRNQALAACCGEYRDLKLSRQAAWGSATAQQLGKPGTVFGRDEVFHPGPALNLTPLPAGKPQEVVVAEADSTVPVQGHRRQADGLFTLGLGLAVAHPVKVEQPGTEADQRQHGRVQARVVAQETQQPGRQLGAGHPGDDMPALCAWVIGSPGSA